MHFLIFQYYCSGFLKYLWLVRYKTLEKAEEQRRFEAILSHTAIVAINKKFEFLNKTLYFLLFSNIAAEELHQG